MELLLDLAKGGYTIMGRFEPPVVDSVGLIVDMVDFVPEVVFDIGAHIGLFSMAMAMKGARRLYVFEPDPRNFSSLVENINVNGVQDRVIPLNLGVGGSYRPDELHGVGPISTGQNSLYYRSNVKTQTTPIQVVDFADIITWEPSIDLMKIDVEGAEFEMLLMDDDVGKELFSRVKHLHLETHSLANKDYFDVETIRTRLGDLTPEEALDLIPKKLHSWGFSNWDYTDDRIYLNDNYRTA